MTDYLVYDVFTDEAFGGNPLAVIPDARGLAENQLQQIAREFNFSESTFVYPPEDPAHTAKVRIFTPTLELPFAGHPTVGTALALHDLGRGGKDMVLELGVGPIPVTVREGKARFETRVPLTLEDAPALEHVAACISQPASAIRTDRHAPVLAGVGLPFILAEIGPETALETAIGDASAFRSVAGEDADRLGVMIYMRDGQKIRARMFAPMGGIPEDPATGSACAALAAYLGHLDGVSQRCDIVQGVEMGRPSEITAEVVVENGKPQMVAISGRAVKTMEGRLTL